MRSKRLSLCISFQTVYCQVFFYSRHEGIDFFNLFCILHSVVDVDNVIRGAHYIYGSHG